MKKFCCTLPNCKRSFETKRGLYRHEILDPIHNRNKHYSGGKKRNSFRIPYERSWIAESKSYKKTLSGPKYIDADILSSMLVLETEEEQNSNNNNNNNDDDDDDDDDAGTTQHIANDQESLAYDESNIFQDDNKIVDDDENNIDDDEDEIDISETIKNVNPELLRQYNVEYIKYQYKLYSEVFGINAIESENLQHFKDTLTEFEIKRLSVLKIYLLAKSCNMSRNNGDDLLELIKELMKSSYPKSEIPNHLPYSWKSVNRAINQQTPYYTCEKWTIPFPEHWEMNKWNCNNAPLPEEVEIRIRDPIELIADQCVNPIIHFLWKDHVHIDYHKVTNSNNEDVYCDIMSSEWARKTLEDIRKIDPNGLLVPIILYADGVSIGMNGNANVTPVMLTLGWYSKDLFKQDHGKMVIGYIDKLTDISEEELIKHLMTVQKFSRTKSEANIRWFKKTVFFTFWGKVLDKINSAANSGILVKILGMKEPQAI